MFWADCEAGITGTPVIMLTALKTLEDKIAGLDGGANDYVVKPFQMEELLARMRSCIRHSQVLREPASLPSKGMLSDGLVVDPGSREVFLDGIPVHLTVKEFELLSCLSAHPGQALSREQIIEAVWGYDFEGEPNIVDVYVGYLRKKIEAGRLEPFIETVRGIGYRFRRRSR